MNFIGCMQPCNEFGNFGFFGVVFILTQLCLQESFPFFKTKETIMVSVKLAKGRFDFIDLLNLALA